MLNHAAKNKRRYTGLGGQRGYDWCRINTSMVNIVRISFQWVVPVLVGSCLLGLCLVAGRADAINRLPKPSPVPGSYGLEATKPQPPPVDAATITTPGNGANFTTSPISVNGICPKGLLVQVYDNGVMVGAVICNSGSFSLQVGLFAGTNELSAIVYDDLGQSGPASNTATVNYTDTRFAAFGQLITLTSSYGRRSAAAGSLLSWPLQLSGGTGPYAFSIDWGDGSKPELKSQSIAGVVTITHVYTKAGVYQVNVKVTDVNGVSAFLQLIAVANGRIDGSTVTSLSKESENGTSSTARPQILWIPTALALLLLVPAFLLGRLSQVVSIRNKMLKERDAYEADKKTT